MRKIIFFIFIFFRIEIAQAHAPKPDPSNIPTQTPCGSVEEIVGEVQVIHSDQSVSLEIQPKMVLPCNTWISTMSGWIKVLHISGAKIQVGEQSFVQLSDQKKFQGDSIVLYQGQVYAEVVNGTPELKLISSTARARLSLGSLLMISGDLRSRGSDQDQDKTQLIALKHSASLENRFETKRKVTVHAGEMTSLDFNLHRVIPTQPQAIAVSQLKAKLYGFKFTNQDQAEILKLAHKRQIRTFASDLSTPQTPAKREIASSSTSPLQYHRPEPDVEIFEHLVNKMVGGETTGEKILFPQALSKKSEKFYLEIEDSDKIQRSTQKEEIEEKNRIIQELSQIRMD